MAAKDASRQVNMHKTGAAGAHRLHVTRLKVHRGELKADPVKDGQPPLGPLCSRPQDRCIAQGPHHGLQAPLGEQALLNKN